MMGTGWATRYDLNEQDNTHREKNNTVRERIIEKLLEVILSALCNLRKYFEKARGHGKNWVGHSSNIFDFSFNLIGSEHVPVVHLKTAWATTFFLLPKMEILLPYKEFSSW